MVITNLKNLVDSAAANHLLANVETYKSNVEGPQGPQGLKGDKGDRGDDGTSVTITSIANNIDNSITIHFSDGTTHTTNPVKGQDGTSITVTDVVNNVNGTMTINFSDGTSHTTLDLTGPKGAKGDTGDHVHHISYQRSKDSLGNEVGPVAPGQSGYEDTYAMWLSQEELPEMFIGEFVVYNGFNGLAPADQIKLDNIEEFAAADQDADEVPYDNTISGIASADVQSAIDEVESLKEDKTNRGVANGYAELDGTGKVPSAQLPSYVDDVLVYPNYSNLPNPGEEGKLYVVPTDETSGNDTSTYRWTTAGYAMVSNTLTEADVKALYEANADTNEFTDLEKSQVAANAVHRTSNGSDHSFIDQDVTTVSSPTFVEPIVDSLQLTGGTQIEGVLRWNDDEKTVDIDQDGTTLQVGQELQTHCRNSTTETIVNGTLVMVTGTLGASGRLLVEPLIADGSVAPKVFIGVSTQDIAAGEDGKITWFGKVRGIDTSAYSEGAVLWADPTVPGAFTDVRPTAPALHLPIALVVNSHSSGTVMVRSAVGSSIGDLHNVSDTAKDREVLYYDESTGVWKTSINNAPLESGYYSRTDSVITFDELSRTLTVSPVGASFTYSMEGENVVISTPKSVVLSDVEGEHFVYFSNIEGTLTETTVFDPAIIYKYAFTASVYWDATNKKIVVLGEERHGNIMDYETHTRLHLVDGTAYTSGLGVVAPTSTTLSTSAGIIRDEDIQLDIESQNSFYTLYKDGATGTWRKSSAPSSNGATIGTSSRLNYNEFTGTEWQVTEAGSINDFVNYLLFATNDIRDGHKVVSIMGQNIYNSIVEARDAIGSELSSLSTTGMAFQEFVPMAVVTLRTNGTIEEITDTRSIKGIATGAFNDHEGLGGLLGGDANGHYHLTSAELAWLQTSMPTVEW